MKLSRCNPVFGAFIDRDGSQRFIVVGGVRILNLMDLIEEKHPIRDFDWTIRASISRFIGGLVDIEDRIAIEIYNPNLDSWELCPPLPAAFGPGHSSQSLSSALFKGKFYVFEIDSCFISSFDLISLTWSRVKILRPPGVVSSFLIPCQDHLVLADLRNNSPTGPSMVLWKVDETTMESTEMIVMPQELLYCLFDREENERFASLKCIRLGNLIYVFNEEHHKCYPACVCEITTGFDGVSRCNWIQVGEETGPTSRLTHTFTQLHI